MLIGRTDELQAIADVYKRVSADGGREVVLIAGEAGLGKTTLAAAAARAAFEDGALVLFGHCEEDLASPYKFFVEALDRFVAQASDDQLAQHVAPHGSDLARLVPSVARKLSPGFRPARASTPTPSATCSSLPSPGSSADMSQVQPVVLVLDDLQWADRGSLLLLRHLAASEQISRLLMVATYRDSELMHAEALRDTLGALRRQSGVQRIRAERSQ